jgi:hypothetical protein
VVRRIAERLIDVTGDIRVKADHFANGHAFLLDCTKPVESPGCSA